MFCNKCGAQSSEGSNFCGGCGAPLATAHAAMPIEVDGATWIPGSGTYAGYYTKKEGYDAGWHKLVDGKMIRATPGREPVSTGRKVAGWICIVVAALAGLQTWSWLAGFADLQAADNPFAGLLAPLIFIGLLATGGFLAAGIVLLQGKKTSK